MIDYERELNEEQYNVVVGGDGPCLVLAGAGSGKTRTITYRVAYLLEHGVPQEQILLLTFTNKAAKEMMERVTMLLGFPAPQLWGGTFHSVAARLLRRHASSIGYESNFTIIDADDAEGVISLAMRDEGIDLKSKLYPKASTMSAIISFARNSDMECREVVLSKFGGYFRIVESIEHTARRYEQRKRDANLMDFDDLLLNLRSVLRDHPDAVHALSEQFRYVLVDEYQDTNILQADIVKELSRRHGNVLAVGDDAQSIYSFRAANIGNILHFERDFPGAKIFRLEYNYRSAPEILALANSVIAKNKDQHKKQLRPVKDHYVKPQVVTLGTVFEEARYIADTIEQLHAAGTALHETGVLFRAAHHSQALEVELLKRGIPYDYRGGLRFFDRAHVKDILAFLRVFHNVHDVVAWQRILTMQDGIGDKTANLIIYALSQLNRSIEVPTFEIASDMSPRAQEGWQRIAVIIADMTRSQRSVADMIEAVLRSGYREYVQGVHDNYADRLDDIDQLKASAHTSPSLTQFLTDTSLSEEYGKKDTRRKGARVVLSTIHQAKGLEWDAVFVMRLVQGGFPHERAYGERGGIEEERRLLYVAVTRARKHLYITYPMTDGRDGTQYFEPSMFLADIDPLLIDSGVGDGAGKVILIEGDGELEYVEEGESFTPKGNKRSFLSDVSRL